MCVQEIGSHMQNMLTILGPIVNMIGRIYIWPLNEHKNLHFDNEWDIHMSSKPMGKQHDLDLFIIISH